MAGTPWTVEESFQQIIETGYEFPQAFASLVITKLLRTQKQTNERTKRRRKKKRKANFHCERERTSQPVQERNQEIETMQERREHFLKIVTPNYNIPREIKQQDAMEKQKNKYKQQKARSKRTPDYQFFYKNKTSNKSAVIRSRCILSQSRTKYTNGKRERGKKTRSSISRLSNISQEFLKEEKE